jgi:hypothetical protein
MNLKFVSLLFLTTTLLACPDINFYKTHPELLEEPVVNQGNLNVCYAHTLAGLYNFAPSINNQEKVHPFWVAYIHKKRYLHWKPRNLAYTFLPWANKDLLSHGNCSYENIEDNINLLKNGVPYSNDQLFFLLYTFFKKKSMPRIWKSLQKTTKFETPWKEEDIDNVLKRLIESDSRGVNFFSFLEQHVFKNCGQKKDLPKSTLSSFGHLFESNNAIEQKILKLLDKNKMVASGYCLNSVYGKYSNTAQALNTFPRISRAISYDCGAHYSLVVGSRLNTKNNRCEFLLRNSYGEGYWASENQEYWCQDKITGEQKNCHLEHPAKPLQKRVLGAWVDAKRFVDYSYDHSYLKDEVK